MRMTAIGVVSLRSAYHVVLFLTLFVDHGAIGYVRAGREG
jgi:hypothetical protein